MTNILMPTNVAPLFAFFGFGGAEIILLLVFFLAPMMVGAVVLLFHLWHRKKQTNETRPSFPAPPIIPMPTPRRNCPQCGKELPTGAPEGLCPACVLRVGLGSQLGTQINDPNAAPPAAAEIAQLFPQFEIIELLGQGGMGMVYKARQRHLDRPVALKILRMDTGRDPAFAERFAREAKALARLNHPNIVTVHDFGQVRVVRGSAGSEVAPSGVSGAMPPEGGTPNEEDVYYLVMELVDGVNLRELIRTGRVKPEEALKIVPPICEALQYAHQQGIVHRDIKPENILVDKQGRVKIADFGIAKILGADKPTHPLTGARQAIGTPHYMAPEQVEKPTTVDHRADIYSLGVVFYEMLTGELPLGRFAPPSQKVEVDVRLDDIVLRALEKEPERRYQQVSEIKTRVETLSTSAGNRPDKTASAPASSQPAATQAIEPRVSRLAIAGAIWAPFTLLLILALAPMYFVHSSSGAPAIGVKLWLILAMVIILPLGLTAPFGTTILGYLAIGRIRRSAGRISGMGLALFDALLFPLLFLDVVINFLGAGVYQAWALFAKGTVQASHHGEVLFVIEAIVIVAWIVVDFLIARWACRKVNSAPQFRAADETKPGQTREVPWWAQRKVKAGSSWRKHAEAAEAQAAAAPWLTERKSVGKKLVGALVIVALLVLAIGKWIITPYRAEMDPAGPEIPHSSIAFVFKLNRAFRPGDVIVFKRNGKPFLGRVAGEKFATGSPDYYLLERSNGLSQQIPVGDLVGKVLFSPTGISGADAHANLHYRVFEIPASIIDEMVLRAERARPDSGRWELTAISAEKIEQLVQSLPPKGLLVNSGQDIFLWPEQAVAQTFSGSQPGWTRMGHLGGQIGARRIDGKLQERIELQLSFWIDEKNQRQENLFYQGFAPRSGAVAFLVPFAPKNEPPTYLFIGIEAEGEVGETPADPIRIVAIGQPSLAGSLWWDLKGQSVEANPAWLHSTMQSPLTIIWDRNHLDGMVDTELRFPDKNLNGLGVGIGGENGWNFTYASQDTSGQLSDYIRNGGRVELIVRRGVGDFTPVASIREGQTIEAEGGKFTLKKVEPGLPKDSRLLGHDFLGNCHIDANFNYNPSFEIAWVAVDKNGNQTKVPEVSGSGNFDQREDRTTYQFVQMDKADIDHFVILKRPITTNVFFIPTQLGRLPPRVAAMTRHAAEPQQKAVRAVVSIGSWITFEGRTLIDATNQLEGEMKDIPDRAHTTLEIAKCTEGISQKEFEKTHSQLSKLARSLGFASIKEAGLRPSGSRGTKEKSPLQPGPVASDDPNWRMSGNDTTNYLAFVTSDTSHSGKASIGLQCWRTNHLGSCELVQTLRATEVRGKRLQFSAFVQTLQGPAPRPRTPETAALFMRIEDGHGNTIVSDEMEDRPILVEKEGRWRRFEIVLDVPEKADYISFGIKMNAGESAHLWVDDMKFEVVNDKTPLVRGHVVPRTD